MSIPKGELGGNMKSKEAEANDVQNNLLLQELNKKLDFLIYLVAMSHLPKVAALKVAFSKIDMGDIKREILSSLKYPEDFF